MSQRKLRFYRPELDALRFFAFLCVFQHHVKFTLGLDRIFPRQIQTLQDAGSYGVCLFFLLSAYLITELLCKERDESHDIHLRSFYIRRVLRIWPLYFAFLGFAFILGLVMPHFRISPSRLLAFLFLAGNWYTGIFGWTATPIFPLWSISVEEQFYLLIPTIMKYGGKRALWAISILFLALSYSVLAWMGQHAVRMDPAVWTNSFVQFQFFAAGCILAVVLRTRVPELKTYWRAAIVIVGLLVWMTAANVTHHAVMYAGAGRLCLMYGLILVGTVLIFLAFLGMNASLIPKPIRYLGQISYGLYVFHYAIADGITAIAKRWPQSGLRSSPFSGFLDLALTIGVASLSYQCLERPFLRLKERYAIIKSRPA